MGAWEQTLIFSKWHAPITRLSMCQWGPIEVLAQIFLQASVPKFKLKVNKASSLETGIWFRDSSQVEVFLLEPFVGLDLQIDMA